MSLMQVAAAAPSRNVSIAATGFPDAGGADNLEQMFEQLMQQLQASLEQPVDGAALPLDGEGLPLSPEQLQELTSGLAEFAGQLKGGLPEQQLEQLEQLDSLMAQLAGEKLPPQQIEQLAQAALLMQDAQLEKQGRSDSLAQLVGTIRSSSAEASASEALADKERSLGELLALADRMRSGLQAEELPQTALQRLAKQQAEIAQNAAAQGSRAEADVGRANNDVEASEQTAEALLDKQGAQASDLQGRSNEAIADRSSLVDKQRKSESQSSVLEGASVDADPEEVVIDRVQAAAVPAPQNSATVAGSEAQAVKAAPVSPQPSAQSLAAEPVKGGVEEALAAGSAGERQDEPPQGRRESLSRWVELRDTIAAQGQKLAQNDGEFKAVSSTSSLQAEVGSLLQGGRNSSLTQLQQTYQTSTAGGLALSVGERFGGEKWTPAASQRILWMAGQNVSSAELRLDPPELGSLSVRLNIQGDQASLSFTSPHANVRDALEQQMPRLREMLAENGIELDQADVSDQSLSKESDDRRSSASSGRNSADDIDSENQQDESQVAVQASLSLVDYYA